MLRPELRDLQKMYDEHMEEKTMRHLRLRRELEDQLAREDFEGLKPVVKKAHEMFRLKSASKMELREALRQYGSPKFKELWEVVPYDVEEVSVETYNVDSEHSEITFYRSGWDWTGIDPGVEELTFGIVESENSGLNTLSWSVSQEDHAMFSFRNLSEAEKVLNK